MVRTVTVALFKERRQKPYGSFKNEQNLKQTHSQQYNEELNMLEIKISLPNITNKRKRGRERRRKERRREEERRGEGRKIKAEGEQSIYTIGLNAGLPFGLASIQKTKS